MVKPVETTGAFDGEDIGRFFDNADDGLVPIGIRTVGTQVAIADVIANGAEAEFFLVSRPSIEKAWHEYDKKPLSENLDLMHVTAQGVLAGANMVLVDFHPNPSKALVDGPQALRLDELPQFIEDVAIARDAYLKRVELASRQFRATIPG